MRLAAAILLLFLFLTGCVRTQSAEGLRYRLTVWVDTGEGVESAGALFDVAAEAKSNRLLSGESWTGLGCRVGGEAAGPFPGTRLFMLTTRHGRSSGSYHCRLAARYLGIPNGPSADAAWRERWAQAAASRRVIEIEPEDYPGLAEIADFQDRGSALPVPDEEARLRIRRVVLEVTGEPLPPPRLLRLLPWLADLPAPAAESTGLYRDEFIASDAFER